MAWSAVMPMEASSLSASACWDPTGGGEAGVGVAAQVAVLAGPGVLDDGPGIAGEVGAVDDEGGDGTVAAGFLKLVGPAAVVGEGFAFEELFVGGGRLVDDDEDDLALDVDAAVVVPAVFGCDDAVADEDDGGVDGGRGRGGLVVGDEVGAEGEVGGRRGFRAGAGDEAEVGICGDGLDADEGHSLQKRTVVAGGYEAIGAEGVCDEVGGEDAAGLAGASAFKLVAGKGFDGGAKALGVNGGGFGLGNPRTAAAAGRVRRRRTGVQRERRDDTGALGGELPRKDDRACWRCGACGSVYGRVDCLTRLKASTGGEWQRGNGGRVAECGPAPHWEAKSRRCRRDRPGRDR